MKPMLTKGNPMIVHEVYAVTPERWPDLEMLFGKNGACDGCWCMWWRLKHSDFLKQRGDANKEALKSIVDSGEIPGLLAYADGNPVAWCSIAPRQSYTRLERSRVLKRVDDQPVWSIVCFFVAREFRRQGLTGQLLEAAAEYARKRSATVIEGYPIEPRKGRMPDAWAYTGLASSFRNSGFEEVARRSETRPMMRKTLTPTG